MEAWASGNSFTSGAVHVNGRDARCPSASVNGRDARCPSSSNGQDARCPSSDNSCTPTQGLRYSTLNLFSIFDGVQQAREMFSPLPCKYGSVSNPSHSSSIFAHAKMGLPTSLGSVRIHAAHFSDSSATGVSPVVPLTPLSLGQRASCPLAHPTLGQRASRPLAHPTLGQRASRPLAHPTLGQRASCPLPPVISRSGSPQMRIARCL